MCVHLINSKDLFQKVFCRNPYRELISRSFGLITLHQALAGPDSPPFPQSKYRIIERKFMKSSNNKILLMNQTAAWEARLEAAGFLVYGVWMLQAHFKRIVKNLKMNP
ncbi:MAG: hypothetical protein CVV34_07565 [Methanomicrobiales archaeon HGW-Methanomicrobiales-5]|nr:MAG: hypothetical protein CVV34_07565 [Methanomicrobiales archaeon HGW-Methanomicrobiales-5]